MGHAYPYHCNHCGYEEVFNEGHGYLVHSQSVSDYLKRRTKLFHYKTHKLIQDLSDIQGDIQLKAGFQVYKCPKCSILYDKVDVQVFNDSVLIHRSSFRCRVCQARLKRTNIHRLKEAVCPKCKRHTFHIRDHSSVLWKL